MKSSYLSSSSSPQLGWPSTLSSLHENRSSGSYQKTYGYKKTQKVQLSSTPSSGFSVAELTQPEKEFLQAA